MVQVRDLTEVTLEDLWWEVKDEGFETVPKP